MARKEGELEVAITTLETVHVTDDGKAIFEFTTSGDNNEVVQTSVQSIVDAAAAYGGGIITEDEAKKAIHKPGTTSHFVNYNKASATWEPSGSAWKKNQGTDD